MTKTHLYNVIINTYIVYLKGCYEMILTRAFTNAETEKFTSK